jgi:hypothetical protein
LAPAACGHLLITPARLIKVHTLTPRPTGFPSSSFVSACLPGMVVVGAPPDFLRKAPALSKLFSAHQIIRLSRSLTSLPFVLLCRGFKARTISSCLFLRHAAIVLSPPGALVRISCPGGVPGPLGLLETQLNLPDYQLLAVTIPVQPRAATR